MSDEELAEERIDMMYDGEFNRYYCSNGESFDEYDWTEARKLAIQQELNWLRLNIEED